MRNPVKRIKNKIKYINSNEYKYLQYWYSCSVDDKAVLIEPGRGETSDGNMFAVLKEIELNPKWADYTPYFVITAKTREKVAAKFKYYDFKRVKTVVRESDEYLRLLATCKYFFSDNTYPAMFCKKPDQVYTNTWHGTPLKKMGRANISGARGLGNVQRNFFMADYALFPNDLTKGIFMNDYMLRNEFSGEMVMLDYPRNDAFHDDAMRARIRGEQNVEGLQVLAYMPTWRGGDSKDVSMDEQITIVSDYLREIDDGLTDDQVLFVNMHPFVGSRLVYDDYRHIRPFPVQYETYDFLNIADVLITDYSSVMFDFAETERNVLLFVYDYDEYMRDRGVYIDINDLPFRQSADVASLLEDINDSHIPDYTSFIKEFCSYRGDPDMRYTDQLLDLVIKGSGEGIVRERITRDLPLHVLAAPNLNEDIIETLRTMIERQTAEGRQVIVTFEGGMKASYAEAFRVLNEEYPDIDYYSLVGGLSARDIPRETQRIFPGWQIDTYNRVAELRQVSHRLLHHLMPVTSYSIHDTGSTITLKFRKKNLSYLCKARLNEYEYELKQNGSRYSIVIPKSDILTYKTRNRIRLVDCYDNEHKIIAGKRLSKWLKIIHTKLISLSEDRVCYLQEYVATTDLLVRERNYTDRYKERIKFALAYILSKLSSKKNRPVILYEKNSERYEESASVLYEKLMDNGYTNAYFTLDRNCPQWDRVPEQYRKNILRKYSFKHYYTLFRAKSVIATETITHNIDLRPVSPFVRYWLQHAGFSYVFLQHGVMYMISLDSENRAFFKQKVREGYLNRIVVSSQREADHFIELGGVDPQNLYISGLLKFDRAVRGETHDRIAIMPTWRPWEAVLASEDFKLTSYYRFVENIYNSIPDELKENVVVLPHPLMKKYAMETGDKMVDLMLPEVTHDDVLKMTDTLITDYSSISYDAFYRGCNVIFYWKEKDETVSHYGPTAKLMLTEDLAFGEVCYDEGSLTQAISAVYGKEQETRHVERFRELVTFHDGRNTDRFIEMIKKDKIL